MSIKRNIARILVMVIMMTMVLPSSSFAFEATGPVSVTFGSTIAEYGINVRPGDSNGSLVAVTKGGKEGSQTNPTGGISYIYCNVDDSYINGGKNTVEVTIEYYDSVVSGAHGFSLVYNSMITAWSSKPMVPLKGTKQWKTVTFTLDDAKFANESNGSDFRIETDTPVCFGSIVVKKIPQVKFTMNTAKFGNMFVYGEDDAAFNIVFDNELETDETMAVTYKVLSESNNVIKTGTFNKVLIAGTTGAVEPITIGQLPKGTFTVSVDAVNATRTIRKHDTMPISCITDVSGKTPSGILGACAHFGQNWQGLDELAPMFGKAGITAVRDEYYWWRVENEEAGIKGQYTFPADWDNYVAKETAQGLKPLIVLTYTNKLHCTGEIDTPEEVTAYANYATAVVTHLYTEYGVDTYEVYNEWNGGLSGRTAAQYFELLKATYNAIKGLPFGDEITVVGGAAFEYPEKWFEDLFALGMPDYMDAISFHPYVNSSPEAGKIMDKFQDARNKIDNYYTEHPEKERKDIEIWATEIGWPTNDISAGGFSKINSASYGIQLYTLSLANPNLVDKIFWYDFLNDGTDPAYFEHNQGMLSLDAGGAPKPSFVAFNAATDILSGVTPNGSYSDIDISAYRFSRSQDDVLVVWAKTNNKTFDLNLPDNETISVADIFGNTKSYKVDNGKVTLTASTTPIYILGSFRTNDLSSGTILTPAFDADSLSKTTVAGEDIIIDITRRFGAEDLSGTYTVDLPDGWTVESGAQFSASGSEQTTDTLTVHVSSDTTQAAAQEICIYPTGASNESYGLIKIKVNLNDAFIVSVGPAVNDNGDGWDVAVNLSNQYANAEIPEGTVTVLEPESMKGTKGTFGAISAREKATVTFSAPMLAGGWTTKFKLQIDRPTDNYSQVIEKNISCLTAVKAPDNSITIDGVISTTEWENAMTFELNDKYAVKSVPNWTTDDISSISYVKWDEQYMYLATSVTDDVHVQNYDAANSWNADSIQMAFDPARPIKIGIRGRNELNIALNTNPAIGVMKHITTSIDNVSGKDLENSDFAIERDEANKKTNYEMAIKWSDILPADMTVASGMNIGFSLLVNDNDATAREGWIEYMSGIGSGKEPAKYGDLILTDRESISIPYVERPVEEDITPIDPSDLAQLAEVTATGISPTSDVKYLKDGNDETCTQSQDYDTTDKDWRNMSIGPEYVTFIWDEGQTFNKVILKSEWCQGQAPTNWDIEVSDDGSSNWTKVAESGDVTWAHHADVTEAKELIFEKQADKKGLRVKIYNANLEWSHYVIAEIEIRNVALIGPNDNLASVAVVTGTGMADDVVVLNDGEYSTQANSVIYQLNGQWVNENWDRVNEALPSPQSITLNWDEARSFNNVKISSTWAQGQAITNFDVYVSDDGVNGWTQVGASGDLTYNTKGETPELKEVFFETQVGKKGLRIVINKANMVWQHYAIGEIEVYNTNLALSATVSGTGMADDVVVLNDGDYSTQANSVIYQLNGQWVNENWDRVNEALPSPQSITLKWDEARSFNNVKISSTWAQGQAITNFDVYVSDDGDNGWTKVGASGDLTYNTKGETPEIKEVFFETQVGKKGLRIVINKANMVWQHYAIGEIEVYNNADINPIVGDYTARAYGNSPVAGRVIATGGGGSLEYMLGTQAAHGAAIVNSDGSWTYTPAAGYSGTDRFTVNVSSSSGGTAISTINVTVDPVVPQSQMTVTASTYLDEAHDPYKAFDGNINTKWCNQDFKDNIESDENWLDHNSHWITINLGGTYEVDGLTYLPAQDTDRGQIVRYNIYVSMDGEDFTKVVDEERWGYNRELKVKKFDPVMANYVKLESLEGTESRAYAAEINVTYAAQAEATITSLQVVNCTTFIGAAPILPSVINAVYSDSTTVPVNVVWDNIDSSLYSTANDFTVTGAVYGTDIRATANVTVVKPFNIVSGDLNRTAGIKATIQLQDAVEGLSYLGDAVVVFQLMNGDTPVSIVVVPKSVGPNQTYFVKFNIVDPGNTYTVKAFVFDELTNDDISASLSLASPVTLN